ncbi:MAG: UDP-N-acetylmuramoyl-L-alanine--D-glutamate ligase [Campylobacteraceae bacterium]|nr:UDP-N-acetylmuramoyl-L-alanine--D-glutamate ligase [Campylobacteraceae bacterium]
MENKTIRVLGKGITAQAIKKKFDNVILYDESDFSSYDKKSQDITVVSPGIPPYNKMLKDCNNIQSDYDLFSSVMPYSIWISGTNGKTTTTQMLQHLLEDKGSVYGGNIGVPLCSLDEKKNIWILETSSFTLHYTNKAKPNLYILLPISEDHISWHGSYDEYIKAKLKPLDSMLEGEIAIIPEVYKDYPSKACKITYQNAQDLCDEFGIIKNEVDFKEPFLLDALLAMACKIILFDEKDYKKINTFVIDEHKLEELRDEKNRLWVNDTKGTNIDATMSGLGSYKGKKIYLILGGDDKGANLRPLFDFLQDFNIEIFIIGSNFKRLITLCKEYSFMYFYEGNYIKTLEKIDSKLDLESVGILSPAASSLDQFTSYAQRGNIFKEFVRNLRLN